MRWILKFVFIFVFCGAAFGQGGISYQQQQSSANYSQYGQVCQDVGSTDAYACSLPIPISSYSEGIEYRFRAHTANTGIATLNLNGLGAKVIKKAIAGDLVDISDGDICVDQWVTVIYTGIDMQMSSPLCNWPSGGGGGGTVPNGTGFVHVVAGSQDANAKLVADGDVASTAAIVESKLALNNPTHPNTNDPSAGEKAALVGTNGTPGSGNKFVTDTDPRNSNARTPTSHTHSEADVTNLVSDLTLKAPLSSPALTDVPTAPTASPGTNTTQIATTAFVLANAGGGAVSSIFGRTGVVIAVSGDYSFAQIGSTPTTLTGYGITDAVPSDRTVNGKALSSNITLSLASADFVNQGTTTTLLHGNAAGNPAFGQIVNADITNATIDLTAKVVNILPGANGGSGNGFFAVSGPATSLKTYTLPNASVNILTDNALVTSAQGGTGNGFFAVSGPATPTKTYTFPNASTTILTTNAAVTVAQGGTGIASGNSGGIPYFSGTTTIASSAALTANLPVIGGGAGAAPTVGSRSGNTTVFVTATGSLPSGNFAKFDVNGNIIDGGTGGSGNTTSTSLSTNTLPKANGANSIINSLLIDDGTTLTYSGTGGISTPSVTTTGTGPDDYTADAAPASPAANHGSVWFDSTDLRLHDKNSAGTIGTTVVANTGASNQYLTAISAAGVISRAQPSFSNLSGSIASSQQNNPAVGAKGGVEALTCSGTDKLSAIGTNGIPVCSGDQGGAGTGDVVGPSSATDSDLACFDTTTGKLLKDCGLGGTNLVTASANFTSGNVVQAAGNNKTASDSGVAVANLVTAASNYVSGELVQAAGANKTTSSSGVATANVVTAASAAGAAGQIPYSASNNKALSYASLPPGTLTDGATITWAIASAPFANATVTLGGNRTLNITNPLSGGNYVLRVVQDGTGSRTLALGTGCTWKVSGTGAAITPSTAAASIDALAFTYDGTNCYATLYKDFGGTANPVTRTVASGTSALGTGAISSATCATAVTTSATNVTTTDAIQWGFNGDPTAVTGYAPATSGMLTIIAYPTANNVNFKVCNNTTASITPGAITLNWRIVR